MKDIIVKQLIKSTKIKPSTQLKQEVLREVRNIELKKIKRGRKILKGSFFIVFFILIFVPSGIIDISYHIPKILMVSLLYGILIFYFNDFNKTLKTFGNLK